jgi:hypothetical protein
LALLKDRNEFLIRKKEEYFNRFFYIADENNYPFDGLLE